MFRLYYKRCITNPVFYACAVLQAVMMAAGCHEWLGLAKENVISVLYCYRVTTSIGIGHVVLPLISVIPFMIFQVEETRPGAIYFQLSRTSFWKELWGRLAAALLSAVTAMAAALLIFTVIAMACGAVWQTNDSVINWYEKSSLRELAEKGTWQIYLIESAGFLLYAMPWVLIGMVASLFVKNPYIVFAFPFVVFITANFLEDLTGSGWLNVSFIVLLKNVKLRGTFGGGIVIAAGYQLCLCGALTLLYVFLWKRRWTHDGL